jgi:AraC family transcriptional regulator
MTDSDPKRISVVRANKLVPLLPADGHTGIVKEQPWKGFLLEQHLVRSGEIPEHEHRDFCIHLQLSGDSDFEWWSEGKHRAERTEPGTLIVLTPGTKDRLLWQGTSERLIVSMKPEVLSRFAEELGCGDVPEFGNQWALRDSGLKQVLQEMGREAQTGWPLGRLYADLLVLGFQNLLIRRHALNVVHLPEVKGGLTMRLLRHALEYITDNLENDLRLEDIAQELSLSPFHFAREFRASTGQTPYQYLLDQRMERAKTLLKLGRDSIEEIAHDCGFRSPVNFTRAFRQRVGVTPGMWRARG